MDKFYHSVSLDESLCKGCINCLKRCPTEAIRVRNFKAQINSKFCIDCGECIRRCPHHAKKATYDSLEELDKYEYKIALPPPSLYSQFNNLTDVNIVLNGLLKMGFDDVYEVSAAAELVTAETKKYISEYKGLFPLISTACPSVVRLIRVKFPNLISHLLPLNPPVEVAADIAVARAMKKTGLSRDKIAVCFITPCPSKVAAIKAPIATEKTEIDLVFAMKEVYPLLVEGMKNVPNGYRDISSSGSAGINWGKSGGESKALDTEEYLAADGIENVMDVLENLEDEKFDALKFIELNACSGGCIGGVLTVENPYIAKVKLKHIRMDMIEEKAVLEEEDYHPELFHWSKNVEYEPVYKLGDTMIESMANMKQIEANLALLPGLDCGSCGAPNCRAMAEDMLKKEASEYDCIHLLKDAFKKQIRLNSYSAK